MTSAGRHFTSDVLAIDAEKAAETIEAAIRKQVTEFRRRGVVVGLSGGIDSSVVTCVCVRALGAARVHVLLMPERDSSDESAQLARLLTSQLGVTPQLEDIEPILTSAGCYTAQAEAIRLAITKALVSDNEETRPALKKEGFLTRDPRMVERKKFGKRKARRSFQFSKR